MAANIEKVTVDKAYFDALLRRADCHSSPHPLGTSDPVNISISRVEYNSLLRVSREFDSLKTALFQGGIAAETLELLISGHQGHEQRSDATPSAGIASPSVGFSSMGGSQTSTPRAFDVVKPKGDRKIRTSGPTVSNEYSNGTSESRPDRRVPSFQRHTSYGMTSLGEDVPFDDEDDGDNVPTNPAGLNNTEERRTLYLSGLSERTTYRDLLSVITGGKLLSVNILPDRNALVTFYDGAEDFLAWTKRNDIYLQAKRIEVRWADRQFRLNNHIANKVANGATRNIVIKSAVEKGLTEQQIREDMEHIQNLKIIDIVFRAGDAFVATNSVHNALFARTCMMSRAAYRGCKIDFFRDECDVGHKKFFAPRPQAPVSRKSSNPPITNRFNMLNMDGTESGSDERSLSTSEDDQSADETIDEKTGVGVSLRALDVDSL